MQPQTPPRRNSDDPYKSDVLSSEIAQKTDASSDTYFDVQGLS